MNGKGDKENCDAGDGKVLIEESAVYLTWILMPQKFRLIYR
jgi:hypothetical protein